MDIILKDMTKLFGEQLIFRRVNFHFNKGQQYGISGRNGIGKSTLIHLLTGQLSPSMGNISYISDTNNIDSDDWYSHIALATPYIELIPEFTVEEIINFYCKFKTIDSQHSTNSLIDELELRQTKYKALKYFSSGMKQRVALLLALVTDVKVLLLDEPTSFLDTHYKKWFLEKLEKYSQGKTCIIASNDNYDFNYCNQILKINEFDLNKLIAK